MSEETKQATGGPGSLNPVIMPHVGFSSYRLNPNQDNPREVAFALQWTEENQHPGPNILAHLIPGYTERDAQVAATMMQWLGSNVGMSFLEEAIKREPKIAQWLRRRALA
jgi:hypothetical protein